MGEAGAEGETGALGSMALVVTRAFNLSCLKESRIKARRAAGDNAVSANEIVQTPKTIIPSKQYDAKERLMRSP
jgi:hypothetical protein